jgi:dihydrofolate reductase
MRDLAIVVAMTEERVIGNKGDMPWSMGLKSDLAHFKRLTLGNTVIMGYKTLQSIGRPLPDRTNIVLTTSPQHSGEILRMKARPAHSLRAAMRVARQCGGRTFVIGGSTTYGLFLPHAQYLHITTVHAKLEGDTYFPAFDRTRWQVTERRERGRPDPRDVYETSYTVLRR